MTRYPLLETDLHIMVQYSINLIETTLDVPNVKTKLVQKGTNIPITVSPAYLHLLKLDLCRINLKHLIMFRKINFYRHFVYIG